MDKDKVQWKDEDEIDGEPIGPVWVKGIKLDVWQTKRVAMNMAKELELEFEEV